MSDFVTDFLGGADPARVLTVQDLLDVVRDKTGALEKIMRSVPDCGREACPIHGKNGLLPPDQTANLIDDDRLQALTADDMDELALGFTAGAHNALARRRDNKAVLLQNQADLWHMAALRERQLMARQAEQDASSAPEDEQVS